MINIKDEILNVSAQPDVNPRYTIRDNNGNIISDNVQIELKTPVLQEGTPINKVLLENIQLEMLKDSKQLVAEYTLEEDTAQIDIQGLDIVADGGVYDIVLAGHTKDSSQSIHMRINGDEVGPYYYGTDASYTASSTYINTNCGESSSYDGFATITLYCNGNNTILWRIIANSRKGNSSAGGSMRYGMITTHSNIISLQFLEAYGNKNLAAGMTVKIYKRR